MQTVMSDGDNGDNDVDDADDGDGNDVEQVHEQVIMSKLVWASAWASARASAWGNWLHNDAAAWSRTSH